MNEDLPQDPMLSQLLDAARDEQPAPELVDAHWAALAARVNAPPIPPGSPSVAPSGAAPLAGAKLIAAGVGVALVLGLVGGAAWLRSRGTSPSPASTTALAQPASEPAATVTTSTSPEQLEPPTAPTQTTAAPAAEAIAAPPRAEPPTKIGARREPARVSKAEAKAPLARIETASGTPAQPLASETSSCPDLSAEVQLLATIQAQFKSKQPKAALQTIGRWRSDCEQPNLSEEVLAVELLALCELGRDDRARSKAQQFVTRWPKSTLQHRLANSCVASTLAASE